MTRSSGLNRFARDRVHRAVDACARALGDDVPPPTALATVRAVVAEAGGGLAAGDLAAVQRDAAYGRVDRYANL